MTRTPGAGVPVTPAPVTVLAGPTAVGKGTVSAAIRARYPEIWLSVSATTRAPRPGGRGRGGGAGVSRPVPVCPVRRPAGGVAAARG